MKCLHSVRENHLHSNQHPAQCLQHLLRFDYRDARGKQTTRSVEPHGLLVRTPAWYIIAWDPRPDAARLFRADRISSPSVDDTPFVPRPHELVTGVCPDAKPDVAPSS